MDGILVSDGFKNKNILFILASLNLGGVETYISRVVPVLVRDGFRVDVWVINNLVNRDLYEKLSKFANVRILSNSGALGSLLLNISPSPDVDFDLVIATGGTSLLCAALAFPRNLKLKIVVGVYSQYEFIGPYDNYRRKIESKLFHQLAPSNAFYCTDGCKLDHERYFGEEICGSNVSPLLIATQDAFPLHVTASKTIRLLSIGRLVEFKTYNLSVIYLLHDLNVQGYDIHWSVVGSGPLMQSMLELIRKLGIEEKVTFHGEVPYEALPEYYIDADLYIGAGTTLIEAASFGLPAICAVDSNANSMTTGYFADRPGIGTSDFLDGDRLIPLSDAVNYFLRAPVSLRYEMARRSYNAAKRYSIDNVLFEYETIYDTAKIVPLIMPKLFHFFDLFSIAVWYLFGGKKSRYNRS